MKLLRIILISGLSGSGKTTAIKALEDIGFYCVDNLPILLLPKFLELCEESGGRISRVAVVEDIRSAPSFHGFPPSDLPDGKTQEGEIENFFEDSRKMIQALREEGYPIEILFLEASDPILMRRYSETRRQHPLAFGGPILEGIRLERKKLQGLRDLANEVIDTSSLNVHQLKERIQAYAQREWVSSQMVLTLLSFGYSYGIPFEADLVFDARCLPNPYFVEELKRLKGNDPRVIQYVLQWEESQEFLHRVYGLIQFLLPLYLKEGKTHLTIAIGCTGGRHRSIVMIERLAHLLQKEWAGKGVSLSVRHRDAEKG